MEIATKILSAAEDQFSPDVMEVLKNSGIAEYDVNSLTRDDVYHEFKQFGFTTKANVFKFLKSFAEPSSITGISGTVAENPHHLHQMMSPQSVSSVDDVENSSFSTEPNSTADFDETASECSESSRRASINSHQQQFLIPPERPISNDKVLEEYPCGIASPFPLSDTMQSFLNSSRDVICDNWSTMHIFIRDVCDTLKRRLVTRVPYRDELTVTAKRLCQEYPVLQCGMGNCYHTLYEMLRTRVKNASYAEKHKTMAIKRKLEEKKEELSVEAAKATIKIIHEMEGDGIARQVHSKFPSLKDFHKMLFLFSILVKKSKEALIEDAIQTWKVLLRIRGIEREIPAFNKMQKFLEIDAGSDVIKYVLQVGTNFSHRRDIDQPFILMPEADNGEPDRVMIMVDQVPFLSIATGNNDHSVVVVLLSLLASYYILNLTYPKRSEDVYATLEQLIK